MLDNKGNIVYTKSVLFVEKVRFFGVFTFFVILIITGLILESISFSALKIRLKKIDDFLDDSLHDHPYIFFPIAGIIIGGIFGAMVELFNITNSFGISYSEHPYITSMVAETIFLLVFYTVIYFKTIISELDLFFVLIYSFLEGPLSGILFVSLMPVGAVSYIEVSYFYNPYITVITVGAINGALLGLVHDYVLARGDGN